MTGLRQWLVSLQLDGYYDSLVENRIDLDVLPDLTEEDLVGLGLPLGDRKRMMRGIGVLRGRAPPEPVLHHDHGEPPGRRARTHLLHNQEEELRQLTLLFADLVDSTKLAKSLDLEDYRDAIRTYQLCCSDAIRSHFGFVAQFLGDGVVAYFGYPTAEEDDAERAVATALDITRAVAKLDVADRPLAARVGVATGEVLVSDLVSERLAIKGAVLGETPNLAARLQAIGEPGEVIVAGNTRRLLGGHFDCVRHEQEVLKGFSEPQEIWLVRGMEARASRFSARSRGPMSPFVGRQEEVDILRNRWASARQGEGNLVLISGEAGIGKSRLGEWLCDEIAGEPHFRMSYQCSPYHTGSAFFPVMMQIARAAGLAEGDTDDERLDKLERVLATGTLDVEGVAPLFARLLSIPFEHRYGPIDQPPDVIKERTMGALLEQLFGLAAQQPVLVFFEDLHWIDPSTEEVLDLLVERIRDAPILLLCAYRPEYAAPWIGRAGVTHLSLARLDRKRSMEMVAQFAAKESLPPDLLENIVERTEGVPLFLEELTRTVVERRRRGPGAAGADASLPATLKDLLMAKLDSLSSARDIVPLCAAIGRSFSYRLLLAVSGLTESALRPMIDELARASILLPRGDYPDVTLTFRHALIQEAAYETMLSSRARALHARIADAVSERFPEIARQRPEVVAQHLSRAGRAAEARDRWRAAAEIAITRSSNAEACAHIAAALLENTKVEETDEPVTAEITLREMLREPIELCNWGSAEIEQNLRRLYDLREQQGNRDALFSVTYGSCGTHLLTGNLGEAAVYARRMGDLAAETGEPAHAILYMHNRALIAFLSGAFDEAIEQFDRELEMYDPEHAAGIRQHYVADPAIVARVMQSWALVLAGKDDRADARIAEAEKLIDQQAQGFSRIYGLTIIASIQQTRGQAAAALVTATTAWQLAHDQRVPYWEAWANVVRGWAMAATGNPDEGMATLRAGLSAYAGTGSRQMLPYGHALLADACLRTGRITEGLSVMERQEEQVPGNEVRFFDGPRREITAALRAAADAGGSP